MYLKCSKIGLLALSAGAALSLLAPKSAKADLITFDSISAGFGTTISNGYHNLNWSNFDVANSALYFNNYGTNGYTNGTVSAPNVAFDSYGNPATVSSGHAFNLISGYLTGAWNNGLNIQVQGFNGVNQLFNNTYVVNATGPTLESFNYYGVTSVLFTSSGGVSAGYHNGYNGKEFVLDNLTVSGNGTATPEAGSVVGLGMLVVMGGLAGINRRRKAIRI